MLGTILIAILYFGVACLLEVCFDSNPEETFRAIVTAGYNEPWTLLSNVESASITPFLAGHADGWLTTLQVERECTDFHLSVQCLYT
jgi:hypothetical protein